MCVSEFRHIYRLRDVITVKECVANNMPILPVLWIADFLRTTMMTTMTDDYFIPCACARGNNGH